MLWKEVNVQNHNIVTLEETTTLQNNHNSANRHILYNFFSSHSTLSTENMVQCSLSCIYLYPTNLSYKFISYKYTARSLNRTLIFKRNIGHFDLSYTVKPATLAELKEHKLSQQLRLNVFLKSLRIKEFLKSLLFPDVLCNRGESLNIRGKKKTHKQKRNDFNLLRVI